MDFVSLRAAVGDVHLERIVAALVASRLTRLRDRTCERKSMKLIAQYRLYAYILETRILW